MLLAKKSETEPNLEGRFAWALIPTGENCENSNEQVIEFYPEPLSFSVAFRYFPWKKGRKDGCCVYFLLRSAMAAMATIMTTIMAADIT